jgi:hypothetical protein
MVRDSNRFYSGVHPVGYSKFNLTQYNAGGSEMKAKIVMKSEIDDKNSMAPEDLFGPVIFSYSRAQAIEDGVLWDVTGIARLVGSKYPTAFSAGVTELCATGTDPETDGPMYSPETALRILTTLRQAIVMQKDKKSDDMIWFDFEGHALYSICGPGDTAAPVLTVMLTTED